MLDEAVPLPRFAVGTTPVMFVAALTKVVDVEPVPPFAIGNVPVTVLVKSTDPAGGTTV